MPLFRAPDITKLTAAKDFNRLQAALKYKDPTVRAAAAAALQGNLVTDAIPALSEAYAREDDADASLAMVEAIGALGTRRHGGFAVQVLAQIPEAIAVRPLLRIAAEGDPDDVRKRARESLDRLIALLGREGIDLLLGMLREQGAYYGVGTWSGEKAANAAAAQLQRLPTAEKIELLLPLLEEDGPASWRARSVLEATDDPAMIEPLLTANARGVMSLSSGDVLGRLADAYPDELLAALHHTDSEIRRAAVDLMARKAAKDPGDPMTGALLDTLADPDGEVRVRAAGRLLGLGVRTREMEALIPEVLEHPDTNLRAKAVKALQRVDDPRALDALLATATGRMTNSIDAMREAIEALGKSRDERAVHALLPLLEDEHLAFWAARALANIGDVRCIEPLTRLLKAQSVAGGALADFNWSPARSKGPLPIEPLVDALRRAVPRAPERLTSDKARIAMVLITALGRSRDPRAVPAIREWSMLARDYTASEPFRSYLPSDDPDLQPLDTTPHDPHPLDTAWVEALSRIGGPQAHAALEEGGIRRGRGRFLP
jgi:HEAT repeat protein